MANYKRFIEYSNSLLIGMGNAIMNINLNISFVWKEFLQERKASCLITIIKKNYKHDIKKRVKLKDGS